MSEDISQQTVEQLQEYTRGWYDMMVKIWTQRIQEMGIVDTGRLLASVKGTGLNTDGTGATAQFQFVFYGIYMDRGTGNGYSRADNPNSKRNEKGQLQILDKAYRKEHKMGKAREKRPWFSVSWRISQKVIARQYIKTIGDQFVGMFTEDNLLKR